MLASEVKRKNMFSLQSRRSIVNDGDNWSQCGIRSSLWATDSFLFFFFLQLPGDGVAPHTRSEARGGIIDNPGARWISS